MKYFTAGFLIAKTRGNGSLLFFICPVARMTQIQFCVLISILFAFLLPPV